MRPENESNGQGSRSFIEEARRRQIIASAVEVIAEVGYTNASLARIAKHAGISKGVISYHFNGKDDLMHQVVIQLYVQGGEFMGPLIEAAAGHREKLMVYIESNLKFISDNHRHIAAMAEVMFNFRDPEGRFKFDAEEGEKAIMAPLLDLFENGKKAGEFAEFDTRVMAMLLRDAIDGAAGRRVRDPGFDTAAYTEQMCLLFDRATRNR